MQQTLFVSNLPSQTTDSDLETIFSRHGRVLRAWIQPDKQNTPHNPKHTTRRGFVEMHPEDADNVIWIMNGSWYKNRQIDVQNSANRKQRHVSKERTVYIAGRY